MAGGRGTLRSEHIVGLREVKGIPSTTTGNVYFTWKSGESSGESPHVPVKDQVALFNFSFLLTYTISEDSTKGHEEQSVILTIKEEKGKKGNALGSLVVDLGEFSSNSGAERMHTFTILDEKNGSIAITLSFKSQYIQVDSKLGAEEAEHATGKGVEYSEETINRSAPVSQQNNHKGGNHTHNKSPNNSAPTTPTSPSGALSPKDPSFFGLGSGILEGCVFVIDQHIPLKKKVELIKMIKSQRGASIYSVTEKATHLITTQEGVNQSSPKVVGARSQGIHIISKEFVIDSIAQGSKQDEKNYFFVLNASPLPPSPDPTSPPSLSIPSPLSSLHSHHLPKGSPSLTITVPPRSSHPSSTTPPSSGRTPPGFTTRAPPFQPPQEFRNLRVDVNPHQAQSHYHQNPSPKYLTPSPKYSPKYAAPSPQFPPIQVGRAEEYDDDDDDDDDEYSEGEPISRSSSFNASTRAWESATPQHLEDDGCKIFVGGILFDDLEALKKTKDGYTASEEVIAHIQKLKNERLLEIIRIFSRFGTVVRVKQFLEKRHIFITYDNKNSALQALHTLKPLEVRKKIVQEIRERLRAEDRQTILSPRSNFYVRWPHHVDSEEAGGGGQHPKSYFSTSAPSSPTGATIPPKLSWRQPLSPATYQRSYFNNTNNNNNVNGTNLGNLPMRSTSMRSYFSPSDTEQENGLASPASFSETESPYLSAPTSSRPPRYQPPPVRHNSDLTPTSSSYQPPHFSGDSDSDTPAPGIRQRSTRPSKADDFFPPPNAASTHHIPPPIPSTTTSPSPSTDPHAPSPPTLTPTPSLLTPIQPPASMPSYVRKKRQVANDDGAWHKVIVLAVIMVSMAAVYFYNNNNNKD